MTNKKEKMGPLARKCRMYKILNNFRWLRSYDRSEQELSDLALIAPWLDAEYGTRECCEGVEFSLKDASGKVVKTFQLVDGEINILRETTSETPVYWIGTASGRFVSTRGDYFEHIFEKQDSLLEDNTPWRLRTYERRGSWTEIECRDEYMYETKVEQSETGSINYRRKISKFEDGKMKLVSLKNNGKPVSFDVQNGMGDRE